MSEIRVSSAPQAQEMVPLPAAAWVFAWTCLVGQVLRLLESGAQSEDSIPLSMVLGAVIVTWFSYGALTGRTVRLVVVWIFLVLAALVTAVAVVDSGSAWSVLDAATSLVQLVAFARFTASDYFAGQRARPRQPSPPLGGILAIAVVVGVLGGVIGADTDSGAYVHVQF